MSLHHLSRPLLVLLPGLLSVWGMTSCSRTGNTGEEAQVKLAFDSCKSALINHQTDQVMACIPRDVDDYLKWLNSSAENSGPVAAQPAQDTSPGVDLLLRTALDKKVPPDLRATLTLESLMQRVADKRLLNPREVAQISLGPVSINGNRARAELYYQGSLTALRLPFVKEDNTWKIDVMAILPSAELLMRLDRAIKGETEAQQVEQLVSKLPSL